MMTCALLAPINFIDHLLLRWLSADTVNYVIWPFIQISVVVLLTTGWVAYATYLERKISAFMQARLGPMRVGPWGLLQPIADGIKLLFKEDFTPDNADRWIFFVAPYIAVVAAFMILAVVPFGPDWGVITDVNIGILFVLAVSSVGVLALILAGWSSNSKYALMGAMRSSAQMISYEVSMGLAVVGALMFARTLSLSGIVVSQQANSIWFFFYQPIGFFIFLISGIAENNRAPFDLPEAESELVAGFHTEYSGFRWSLFFMAEYAAMVVLTAVATTIYLGGWYFPFVYRFTEAHGYHNLYVAVSVLVFLAKVGLLLYLYFWLRWTLPRFRYDQLMDLGWKWLLPASLINIVVSALALFVLQGLKANGAVDTIQSTKVNGVDVIFSIGRNLVLTRKGKAIAIAFGIANLLITAGMLSLINRRSRDFNLKKQRHNVRFATITKGKPAREEIKGSGPVAEATQS